MFSLSLESSLLEDVAILSTMFTIIIILVAIVATLSWGFSVMGECLAADPPFSPECYSESPNKPTGGQDDPMWWPHENSIGFEAYGPPWPLPS